MLYVLYKNVQNVLLFVYVLIKALHLVVLTQKYLQDLRYLEIILLFLQHF